MVTRSRSSSRKFSMLSRLIRSRTHGRTITITWTWLWLKVSAHRFRRLSSILTSRSILCTLSVTKLVPSSTLSSNSARQESCSTPRLARTRMARWLWETRCATGSMISSILLVRFSVLTQPCQEISCRKFAVSSKSSNAKPWSRWTWSGLKLSATLSEHALTFTRIFGLKMSRTRSTDSWKKTTPSKKIRRAMKKAKKASRSKTHCWRVAVHAFLTSTCLTIRSLNWRRFNKKSSASRTTKTFHGWELTFNPWKPLSKPASLAGYASTLISLWTNSRPPRRT